MKETMMAIRAVFLEWQVNAISDNTAIKRVETLIQQMREREWNEAHSIKNDDERREEKK